MTRLRRTTASGNPRLREHNQRAFVNKDGSLRRGNGRAPRGDGRRAKDPSPIYRAALVIEEEADKLAREASPDPELRERMELRGRVSFTRYLTVNSRGGLPDGAEGELNAACKVPGSAIPFDVWEPTLEQRQREQRALNAPPEYWYWRQRAAAPPGDFRSKHRAHVADRSSDRRKRCLFRDDHLDTTRCCRGCEGC